LGCAAFSSLALCFHPSLLLAAAFSLLAPHAHIFSDDFEEERVITTYKDRIDAIKKFYKEHAEEIQFVGYLLFVLLFSVVVNDNVQDEEFQRHNIAVKTALVQQEWAFDLAPNMKKDLYDVDSIPDIWTWTMGPFLGSVLSGSQKIWPDVEAGHFYRSFRLLGQIQMRQIRVQRESCTVPEQLRARVGGCFAPLKNTGNLSGDSNEDTADYGPYVNDSARPIFQWYSAESLQQDVFVGRSWDRYPGSGYNVTIPRDFGEAQRLLTFYKDNNWIDIQTRAVFIDLVIREGGRVEDPCKSKVACYSPEESGSSCTIQVSRS
jgi:hypothetical protein